MVQIKMVDLIKKYTASGNGTVALDHVSLEINEGEMVAVMGPSGSGKTSLLNILGCLDNRAQGDYYLNEKLIDKLNGDKLAETRNKSLGFIFQQFALIDEYTVEENVELPLIYRNLHCSLKDKLSRKEIRKRVFEKLEALGIKEQFYKIPSQLSGGQQQRVAIARALIAEPDIIIADEPTGALDQKTGQDVMKLLVNINKEGKTVIIVTHDEKVAAYCKRRIDIVDGKIVSDKVTA